MEKHYNVKPRAKSVTVVLVVLPIIGVLLFVLAIFDAIQTTITIGDFENFSPLSSTFLIIGLLLIVIPLSIKGGGDRKRGVGCWDCFSCADCCCDAC